MLVEEGVVEATKKGERQILRVIMGVESGWIHVVKAMKAAAEHGHVECMHVLLDAGVVEMNGGVLWRDASSGSIECVRAALDGREYHWSCLRCLIMHSLWTWWMVYECR